MHRASVTGLLAIFTATVLLSAPVRAAASARPYDFNGDGRADLVVGAPDTDVGSTEDAGAVHVLFQGSNGVTTADRRLTASTTNGATSRTQGARFGAATASADLDRDGYAELIVGAPGTDDSPGQIIVFYGYSSGLRTTGVEVWDGAVEGVRDAIPGGHLGWSLAIGDWNDDGITDLAIGAPQSDVGPGPAPTDKAGAGMALVVYGPRSGSFFGSLHTPGRFQEWHQDVEGVQDEAEADPLGNGDDVSYERFGGALATGDFDGDSRDDLAIGVPGEFVGAIQEAGAFHVLYGTDDGLQATRNQFWHQDSPGIKDKAENGAERRCELCEGEFGDRFASVLAAGDFDGDGFDDIAAGIPDEELLDPSHLGYSLDYYENGAVAVLYGSSTGITDRDQFWTEDSPGIPGVVESDYDRFGAALAVGDFDRDGYEDLAVGSPGEGIGNSRNDAGTVTVIYGRSSGLSGRGSRIFHQDSPGVPGTVEIGDAFGYSLQALNLGRGSYTDLVVGVPDEDVGSIENAGLVEVLYGSADGISGDGAQAFSTGTAGVKGTPQTGARFAFVSSTYRDMFGRSTV